MRESILPISNRNAIPIGNLPFGINAYDGLVSYKNDETGRADQVKAYLDALQKRRAARLRQIIEDMGSQTIAVGTLKKNQGQLSQLARGKKPIGEALARDLELAAGKPFGWLDHDEEQGRRIPKSIAQDAQAKKLWGMWPKLSIPDRRELCAWAAGALRRGRDAADEDRGSNRTILNP